MFYIFDFEPNPQDMESRGSDRECIPQKHELKSGGFVWLVSAEGDFDMSGLSLIIEKNSPSEIIAWLEANTVQEAGE